MELPTWDNSEEYASLQSPLLIKDLERLELLAKQSEPLAKKLAEAVLVLESLAADNLNTLLKTAIELHVISNEVNLVYSQLYTYIDSAIALNSKNKEALDLLSDLKNKGREFYINLNALYAFILRIDAKLFQQFIDDERVLDKAFAYKEARKTAPYLLSLAEESLITELEEAGYRSFSELYSHLTASMECELLFADSKQTLSYSETLNNLEATDHEVRAASWHAIQESFKTHSITCASILNSRASWNINILRKRQKTEEPNYLMPSLLKNRLSEQTLEALFTCLENNKDVGQEAIRNFARAWKTKTVEPYNLKAPAPELVLGSQKKLSFFEAIDLVEKAYSRVNPKMGEFIKQMLNKNYIDARPRPNRRASAYCTGFRKSGPRVFINYSESMMGARVLAHELGHAYHSYIMKDLPLAQTEYPMTLAETASIFGEIIFSHVLKEELKEKSELYPILWLEAEMAVVYMTNIPMRFAFEKALMEEKLTGRNLFPEDLNTLMKKAWSNWHGDTTSKPDQYFWAHKLHFHHYPFYNFPYSFGYLFGYAVYAKWLEMGEEFFPRYNALLCDTGRMTVEELIKTHLDEDCQKVEFWQKGAALVKDRVKNLGEVLGELGL